MKVSEFMTKNVVHLSPNNTVADAAKLMLDHNISVVPIVDGESHLVGIITESDFIGKSANIPHARSTIKRIFGQLSYFNDVEQIFSNAKKIHLEQVMTKNPKTINPNYSLSSVVSMMVRYQLKKLPVVEDDKLVGIITRHDVLKAFLNLK